MNSTTQNNPATNQEEIGRLACQLWQTDGRPSDRDLEYWLRAEQQLRSISQQGNDQTGNALTNRKIPAAAGKKSKKSIV